LVENQPIFPNARGGRLSSHGVHYLLNKHVTTATVKCPSLKGNARARMCFDTRRRWTFCKRGLDRSLIALWLGHESVETTQIYLDANLAIKQAVHDKTTPPEGTFGRYRPDDRLLAFLKGP
jgi:site-specific recombinase XerD